MAAGQQANKFTVYIPYLLAHLQLLDGAPGLALEVGVGGGERRHLGAGVGAAALVVGHAGVGAGVVLVHLLDGQRHVAKVEEGRDPAGGQFNRTIVWPKFRLEKELEIPI